MSIGPLPRLNGARPRVALYGHDTQGLGHLRRNLALANAYAGDIDRLSGADVLIMTGAPEVGMFPRPRGVDAIVLPGVRKDADGSYEARRLRTDLDTVVDLRRATLTTALTTYAPDVLIVDKTPWGFADELTDVLVQLRRQGTKLVLGLRDVLDDEEATAQQWTRDKGDLAVTLLYEEIWIYGDPAVHDLVAACGMSEAAAAKARYVGYLANGRPVEHGEHRPLGRDRYVLVTAGGGQDGAQLVQAACGMGRIGESEGIDTVILTGPHMATDEIEAIRAQVRDTPGVHVLRFSRHSAAWIGGAEAVIAMGGANTVAEVLATDTPALIVPRISPRREQLVRAQELHRCAAVDTLHPDELSPQALKTWLEEHIGGTVDRSGLALDGIAQTVRRVRALVGVTQEGDAENDTDPAVPVGRGRASLTHIRKGDIDAGV